MTRRPLPRPVPPWGFTLLELTVVLLVVGVVLAPLAGKGLELRSRSLVAHATYRAASLLSRARWVAVSRGGASVEFTTSPPAGRLLGSGGDTLVVVDLGDGGVTLSLSRGRSRSRIRYGPSGLGLVASQTLVFSQGGVERRLVVSSLGRVRSHE